MSEEAEKPFDAPPSRIARARREGNVPRAQELGANLALAAAALAVVGTAPAIGGVVRHALATAAGGGVPAGGAAAAVRVALLPMAAAAGVGVIASIAQSGGPVVTAPAFKFERLNPVEGMKRMLSRESFTHGARAMAAFSIAACAIVPTLGDLARASSAVTPLPGIGQIAWRDAARAVFAAAAIGLLFSFAEYAAARRSWLRKLRMSFAELKRELKENDGDPLTRSRRKALHRSLLRGSIAKVKDASFVVVNPTHVAVALEYRPPSVPVPSVLVRAADEMALLVRELAVERSIPIVENVALARALYAGTRVGEPIAHEHYVAVAEVVAALYRSGALSA